MVGGKPKSCKTGDPAGCPKGFYCNQYFDVESDQQAFVCCGKTVGMNNLCGYTGILCYYYLIKLYNSSGYCDGGVPYLDPTSQEAKECRMDDKNVCPKDFNCRTRNSGSNEGFCCKDLDAVEPPPVGKILASFRINKN